MRLTVLAMLLPLSLSLPACGGGGSASTAAETVATSELAWLSEKLGLD